MPIQTKHLLWDRSSNKKFSHFVFCTFAKIFEQREEKKSKIFRSLVVSKLELFETENSVAKIFKEKNK